MPQTYIIKKANYLCTIFKSNKANIIDKKGLAYKYI